MAYRVEIIAVGITAPQAQELRDLVVKDCPDPKNRNVQVIELEELANADRSKVVQVMKGDGPLADKVLDAAVVVEKAG